MYHRTTIPLSLFGIVIISMVGCRPEGSSFTSSSAEESVETPTLTISGTVTDRNGILAVPVREAGPDARLLHPGAVIYLHKHPQQLVVPKGNRGADFYHSKTGFVPRFSAVEVNQPVRVHLPDDGEAHHIRFENDPGSIRPLQQTGIITRKFSDEEMCLNFSCAIHAAPHGALTIVPNSIYMFCNPQGRYSLKIPHAVPGKYTIAAYHPEIGKFSQEIEIADVQAEVHLDVRFPASFPPGWKP